MPNYQVTISRNRLGHFLSELVHRYGEREVDKKVELTFPRDPCDPRWRHRDQVFR